LKLSVSKWYLFHIYIVYSIQYTVLSKNGKMGWGGGDEEMQLLPMVELQTENQVAEGQGPPPPHPLS
jgi:hypothetical protein